MPHIHPLIDFTVGTFLVHDGKVALIYHRELKQWLCVGGHIELDEDPNQALFREIHEEAGIAASDLIMLSQKPNIKDPDAKFLYTPAYSDIHQISPTHRHVVLVYFLISKTGKLVLNKDEHHDIRWFSKEELNDPAYCIMPKIKFYSKEALRAAGLFLKKRNKGAEIENNKQNEL